MIQYDIYDICPRLYRRGYLHAFLGKGNYAMSFHISYEYRIMIIIMIVSFINPFTSSALNLALPDIGHMYSASESQLSWIIETFLMTSTICISRSYRKAARIPYGYYYFYGIVLRRMQYFFYYRTVYPSHDTRYR